MSPKQREAVEHAYLAIKLPMGVQAARDTLAKLREAFPSIEDRTLRKVAADAVTTGTGYARTTEDGTLQHVPAEEVHIDLSTLSSTCHCSAACQDLGIDKCRYHRPAVGSTIETAGCYCDQVANPQECKDAGRCIMKASVINERRTARELISRECDWPAEGKFTFHDDPGAHDPCYIVMPGGAALPVNHHAAPGVDIARAKFIVEACNAALTISDDEDETFYEIGKRDGYEDAIQDLDLATGGDGEFKGSTIPGGTVDVPAMKARIIERLAALPPEPAGLPGREDIERAVKHVLATHEWPINETYDDAGLSEDGYVDFVTQILALLPAPSATVREALRERLLSEGAISLHEGSSPSYSNCEDDDEGAVIPIPVRLRDDLIAALGQSPVQTVEPK